MYSQLDTLKKMYWELKSWQITQKDHHIVPTDHDDAIFDSTIEDEKWPLIQEHIRAVSRDSEDVVHKDKVVEVASVPWFLDEFIQWFKIDRPMKIWWLLLVLGMWWFVTYAIQNGWISPWMRVILTSIVWFIMIWLWWSQITKQPTQWSYLLGVGSAVYVVAIFLGLKIFWLYSTTIGLLLIALQYSRMLYFSHRYKNHRLSDVGLFYALLCPFIFSTGSGNIVALFIYMSIHVIGWLVIAFFNKRSLSRLVSICYVVIYTLLCFNQLSDIVVSLVFGLSILHVLVELYFTLIKKQIWSHIQYYTLIVSALIGFVVLSIYFPWHTWLVTTLLWLGALWYGTLRYIHSLKNPQSVYSTIVGCSSILYTLAIAYHHLSGLSLLLAFILIIGYIVAMVLFITKKASLVGLVSWWAFPLLLVMILYYWIIGDANSTMYFVSVYTLVAVLVLLLLGIQKICPDKHLMFSIGSLSLVLLVHVISMQFDGYMRILLLILLLWFVMCIGLLYRFSRVDYTIFSLGTVFVPVCFFLGYPLSVNLSLFWYMILIISICMGWLYYMSKYLQNWNDTTKIWIYSIILLLYRSVVYIVLPEWYSIVWTVISMLLYLYGTRINLFMGTFKYLYWLFFIIPIVSLVYVGQANVFISTLSFLLLSASSLFMQFDAPKKCSNTILWMIYVYYLFCFLFLWLGVYSTSSVYLEYQTSILILLILFSLIGLSCYIVGKYCHNNEYRTVGTVLLLAVVIRLLTVELWMMSMMMRIIVCLLIWVMMIGSGFVGNKKTYNDKDGVKY
jgi:hypothetical protein